MQQLRSSAGGVIAFEGVYYCFYQYKMSGFLDILVILENLSPNLLHGVLETFMLVLDNEITDSLY